MTDTRIVIKTSSQEEIVPPIVFEPTPFSLTEIPRAIYIKDFNEVFTELGGEERESLLENLEDLLEAVEDDPADPTKDCVIYIEFTESDELTFDMCIEKLNYYLGEGNNIATQLMEQRETSPADDYNFFDFKRECQDRGITSYWGGGVYGKACVMNSTTEAARFIHTRLAVTDVHPNIRRIASEPGAMRFEKATICPQITEGHTDESKLLPEPVIYPTTTEFQLPLDSGYTIKGRAEEKLRKHNPAFFASYEKHTEIHSERRCKNLTREMRGAIHLQPLQAAIPIVEAMTAEQLLAASKSFKFSKGMG